MTPHPATTLSGFLLLFALQAISFSRADSEPVKTAPHVIPLHFVSRLKDGPVVPVIGLKTDFVAYPGSPLPSQFRDAPANSPEKFVALYLQALSDGKGALTPESLNDFKRFYAPDERTDKEKEAVIEKLINHDYTRFNRHPDTFMWHRYDAGSLTLISLVYPSPYRPISVLTCNLRKIGSSYFLTTHENLFTNRGDDPWFTMFNVSETTLAVKPRLADVPQPQTNYEYGFPLNTSPPGNALAPNTPQIVFNGTLSDVLVDENMVPADATQAFIKRAILTHRRGNVQEFLALWTDTDAKGLLAQRLAREPGEIPLSSLGLVSTIGQSRIVFTIDCGFEAIVFLRTSYSNKLERLVVWKKAPDDYRLCEIGRVETQDPKVHESTIVGSTVLSNGIGGLFTSSVFQNYLNNKVDEFIKEKKSAAPLPPK